MGNLLVTWNGSQKIKGVVALRTVFDLGLKEAVDILNSYEGFVVSPVQWIALRGEYMLKMTTTGNSITCSESPDRSVDDWLVEPYVQALPTWLLDKDVRDDILEGR